MKVAVVGSRSFEDLNRVREYTRYLLSRGHTLISGGAKGVDAAVEEAAASVGKSVRVIRPDYDAHGPGAPFKRNSLVVEECDRVCAFWDGDSKGTLDTISKAVRAGRTVVINP